MQYLYLLTYFPFVNIHVVRFNPEPWTLNRLTQVSKLSDYSFVCNIFFSAEKKWINLVQFGLYSEMCCVISDLKLMIS